MVMKQRPQAREQEAVSPVVGVILMVAITVLLSTAVGVVVFDLGQSVGESNDASSLGVRTAVQDNGNVSVQVVTGEADELQVLVNGTVEATLTDPQAGDAVSVEATHDADVSVISVAGGEEQVVSQDANPKTSPSTASGSNSGPTADAGTAQTVNAGTTVDFDGSGSSDPDGDSLSYEWDFTSDGTTDATTVAPSHTYDDHGTYTVTLTVSDGNGNSDTDTIDVTVEPRVSDGLVAYWTYDDDSTSTTLVDEWNNYDGSINGGATYVTGYDGQALSFDGTDDYAAVDAPRNQSFSISVWAKSSTSTWSESGVMASSRYANGFIVHPNSGSKSWNTYVLNNTDNGYTKVNNEHTPSDITVWHHYVLTYDHDTGTATTYFDGTEVNSTTISITRSKSTNTIYLGRDYNVENPGGWNRYLDGSLDNTRLYNRSINGTEVSELYSAGK